MSILYHLTDEKLLRTIVEGLSLPILIIVMAFSLTLLSKGADWMVDGAVSLACRTGLSKVFIGATIVSLGTTMPEVFVSVMAAWLGNPGLALGNGVGSIIADTGLIFGIICILSTVPINRYLLNRTGWIQVGTASLLVLIGTISLYLSPNGPVLGRGTGFLFLSLLAGYLFLTYRWVRSGRCEEETPAPKKDELPGIGTSWFMLVAGLVLVLTGARVLIPSAAEIAGRMGVPDDIIAATLVALGTSLPELMTAITAVRKGHPEIAVGNVVGADVLNCLFVVGAAAAARPLSISHNFFTFHFPAMLLVLYSFRFFIWINEDNRFKKWQGVWLLGIYLIYVFLQYYLGTGTKA